MHELEGADLLRRTAGVLPLDDVAVVRVTGDDVFPWLQGQVTNDVLALQIGASTYALILDAQGKVLSDVHVIRRTDDALLLLPRDRAVAMTERLEGFVVMEDVELAPLPTLAVITIQGPLADRVTDGVASAHPVRRLDGTGFDVLVEQGQLAPMTASLVARARAHGGDSVTADAFELARIREGRAKLGVDFGENTLPQEAGLATLALSFTKGCYVGQEPVVMLEHRGKPPKRLVRFDAPLALVGQAVPTEIRAGDDVAGTLTSIVADAESPTGAVALGLVRRARLERGDPLSAAGHPLAVRSVVGVDAK